LVVSDEEFAQINDLSQIHDLCINRDVVDGFGGFDMSYALSRIFFQDEEHIPTALSKDLPDVARIFRYNREFIEKISSFVRAEMDLFASHLREDDLCVRLGFEGMGIWVFLYELHDCCSLAIKQGKNLYLVEEENEYVLER
jgi:hypothetical protein